MPSIAPLRPETIPPLEPAPGESEYARALELAGFIARAPLRRRRLAALVLLLGALASVAAAIFTPRVYLVDTKILAQRNLGMPSLGNPRRSVPSDSDAPTRAAADVILGRENLVAIVREADLVARWERQRPPILRLKDRVARALTTPLGEEDKERALVSVLEKKLFVQADESTIRISLEWSHPQTAYEIVSLAERNFFAGRSAVEVAVIADTIGILSAEADHQREAVDTAFARVVELRREEMEQVPAAILPTPGAPPPRVFLAPRKPSEAPAPPGDTKIASLLEEKRRAIRAIEEPRQQSLAELEARRARLLMTYTEAHPEVRQVDAELKVLRVEPPTLAELRREEQELVGKLAELASPGKPREVARALPRRVAPALVVPGLAAAPDLSTREDSPELATAKARLLVSTRRYEDLMDRIDSARIELNTAQAAFKYRYVIVEPPEVPREATRPNGVVLALGGLVLSLLLAVFAASAKDLASGRFVETWQVRRKLALPILAEVEEP